MPSTKSFICGGIILSILSRTEGLPQYRDTNVSGHQGYGSIRDSYRHIVDLDRPDRYESEHEWVDHKKYDLDDELWLDELRYNDTHSHPEESYADTPDHDIHVSTITEGQLDEVSSQLDEIDRHTLNSDDEHIEMAVEAASSHEDVSCLRAEGSTHLIEMELCTP
ncbi:hypothetical protein K7432_005999 [Basidiobolus ranarum]|uniref:Uncharacterized protein n=1 Tax=Basidiobolus ranarum TaxID=34480 RepID=A0ABR2W2A9_9FUNG